MTLSKWQVYFLGMILIASPFVLTKLFWINRSVQTKAVVLYIEKTRSLKGTRQTYPVFEYYAGNYRVTSAGNYNLPYEDGDSVNIRYNPGNVHNFKIDTLTGLWIDRIIWLTPILFVWTIIFLPRDFNVNIDLKKGKLNMQL